MSSDAAGTPVLDRRRPDEWSVWVQTAGGVESVVSVNGSIYCGPNDVSGPDSIFELYFMSPPQRLNLRLDRDLAVGTYPIVGSDDDARYQGAEAYFFCVGPDRQDFDAVESGTITIDSAPRAAGDALVASIEAEMIGDDGAVISLTAELNVRAVRQSFDECP